MKPNGRMIRGVREGRGRTLRELEAETGLNRGYLSRLERGHIQYAGDDQVRRIAEALDVEQCLLIDEESTP